MSMDEQNIRELIDACRAGSDDLQLAELEVLARSVEQDAGVRAALARSQRVDTEIRTAMQRVAVPEGLAKRILDRMAVERAPLTEAAVDSPLVSLPAHRGGERAATRRSRRSSWLFATAAMASALVLAFFLMRAYGPPDSDVITPQSISEDARQWVAAIAPNRWRTDQLPAAQFPPSPHLPLRVHRWQPLATQASSDRLVCYDLAPSGAGRVLLFVLVTDRRTENLPARPAVPIRDTQGLCVGAWEDKPRGTVYALAVEGDRKRYLQVIGPRIASHSWRLWPLGWSV